MNSFSTFELGRVVLTYGISEALYDNPLFEEEIMGAFIRYCVRDWSDMEHQEDKDMNDEALATGERKNPSVIPNLTRENLYYYRMGQKLHNDYVCRRILI